MRKAGVSPACQSAGKAPHGTWLMQGIRRSPRIGTKSMVLADMFLVLGGIRLEMTFEKLSTGHRAASQRHGNCIRRIFIFIHKAIQTGLSLSFYILQTEGFAAKFCELERLSGREWESPFWSVPSLPSREHADSFHTMSPSDSPVLSPMASA
jgi:hypothetical protein